METLRCGHCKHDKPDTDFHRAPLNTGRRGRTSWCKLCTNEQNRDRKRLQRKSGVIPSAPIPDYHRDYHLRNTYGLVSADVDDMLAAQGGCAVCGAAEPGTKSGWCVDHDHKTGRVRAILCNGCNAGMGLMGDDTDRVRRAYEYLAWHDFQEELAADPDYGGEVLTGSPADWFLHEVLRY